MAGQVEGDPASADTDQPVGMTIGQIDLMQHAQHRQIIGTGQTFQQGHDFLRRFRIKAGDRFVSQQHARLLGEGPRDGHALRLAA